MSDTQVATPVAQAVDAAIEADDGNLFRKLLGEIMPTLDDAYRENKHKFRPHMGASLQGNPCARAIWYSFNWWTYTKHPARIQRLFNRGHTEEGRFMAMLKMIGCDVHQYDENGKQFKISGAMGHYGGSGDGILAKVPGLPPTTYVVSEFKTHGDKSFTELVKKGMKEAKFEHYVQMQQYMRKFNIPVGLYGAVNKNTDALHWEYVALNPAVADQFIERAERIVWLRKAPERGGGQHASPGSNMCRFCDHKPVCWQGHMPDKNCRSCSESEPTQTGDGSWRCKRYNCVLTREQQEMGCLTWTENKQ